MWCVILLVESVKSYDYLGVVRMTHVCGEACD